MCLLPRIIRNQTTSILLMSYFTVHIQKRFQEKSIRKIVKKLVSFIRLRSKVDGFLCEDFATNRAKYEERERYDLLSDLKILCLFMI